METEPRVPRKRSNPPRGPALPIKGLAGQLKGRACPLRNRADPLRSRACPLRGRAGPLKCRAGLLRSRAGPLRSLAGPLRAIGKKQPVRQLLTITKKRMFLTDILESGERKHNISDIPITTFRNVSAEGVGSRSRSASKPVTR